MYNALALDKTYLPGLNNIGTQQAQPIIKIQEKIQQFLDYAATHSHVALYFYVSDIQFIINSDTVFLVLLKTRNIIIEYFVYWIKEPPVNTIIIIIVPV